MKTADGRYVLPHSTPGSEYEVRVERVDADSVAVLEFFSGEEKPQVSTVRTL
jgi:hypothetical protein